MEGTLRGTVNVARVASNVLEGVIEWHLRVGVVVVVACFAVALIDSMVARGNNYGMSQHIKSTICFSLELSRCAALLDGPISHHTFYGSAPFAYLAPAAPSHDRRREQERMREARRQMEEEAEERQRDLENALKDPKKAELYRQLTETMPGTSISIK